MKYAIITDHTVAKLYGYPLQKWIKGSSLFSFPAGEKYKTRETKEALENALLEASFLKDTTILGLGGGVVSDIAGLIASTYCRGVPLILIPTTLMGMVDASIGGKNGINTPWGKNMIGTYYLPLQVWIEPRFLETLSEEEKYNGYVEMLKHALIGNASLLDLPISESSIFLSIEVKRRIICRDFQERGIRRTLNLGHTIGHALEYLSHYTLSHGQAVARGILIECHLSYQLGVLEKESWEKIQTLFPHQKIPFSKEAVLKALHGDKKSKEGKARFVLLKRAGECSKCEGEYCFAPPQEVLEEVLEKYIQEPLYV